jgi:malic enzyme
MEPNRKEVNINQNQQVRNTFVFNQVSAEILGYKMISQAKSKNTNKRYSPNVGELTRKYMDLYDKIEDTIIQIDNEE